MSPYQLLQGDCLERMAEIPDGSVDMVLCDLPYGTTQNKWDSVIPLEPLWAHYKRVRKKNAAIVLTAAQPFTSSLIVSSITEFKYCWVWDKKSPTGHLNAHHQPMRRTEDVVVFAEGKTTYNAQGLVWNPRKKSRRSNTPGSDNYGSHRDSNIAEWQGYPTNVLVFGADKNKQHPTQKPVALMEYLIRTYTHADELVLDNTMGSGTTGVACMNTARRFLGIERDPNYFEIARKRIEEASDNSPL